MPTIIRRPRREWLSCLCSRRCSVRVLIRAVRTAIWTSGEPVSPAMGCVLLDNGSLFFFAHHSVFPPFKIFPESKYRAGRIPASERAVSRNWEMGRSAWRYLLRIAYECRKVKRKLPGISEIFHARAPDRIRQDSGTIIPGRREVYAEGHKIRRLVAV